ncbi:MAG TPA: RNA polymerase sigma factor SigZ [Bacteroidetes bacterium]|nr:RNA polymerase sigma factor SigZ [Bacteroidota bacterium]
MQNTIQSIWLDLNKHLLAFVSKKVKNKEEAKDIVQDVFVKAQLKIGHLHNVKKLDAWIFQITRNTINDYFRKRQNHFQEDDSRDATDTLESASETQKLSVCMLEMIDLLPEKYKEAVMLSEIEGMSQKELAKQLNISYSGAKSRVQRGREKLKELFLDCCHISTDKYGNIIDYHEKKCSKNCD